MRTGQSAFRLPDGCRHSLLEDCPFDKTPQVTAAREYIVAKRNIPCENSDLVSAGFNHKRRFGDLPKNQKSFLDHYAEISYWR